MADDYNNVRFMLQYNRNYMKGIDHDIENKKWFKNSFMRWKFENMGLLVRSFKAFVVLLGTN